MAIGTTPFKREEMQIGGGFGESVDGGIDFEKDGTISTDGAMLIGGGYGDTGASISAAGVGQFNGALTTDATLTANKGLIGGGVSIGVAAIALEISKSGGGSIQLTRDDTGSEILSGESLGFVRFGGVETDVSEGLAGQILFRASENWSGAGQGVELVFQGNRTGASVLTDNLIIDGSGSVLIGGGFGSSGITMTEAGVLQVDGATTLASTLTVGGGYGSNGSSFSAAGVGQLNGALNSDGTITSGVDGTVRGAIIIAEDSTGDTLPAYIQMGSADGTDAFYFPDNDGCLRWHTSAPTAATDGAVIGGVPAFSGIWFHVSTTDAVETVISAQDIWTKITQFSGTGGNVAAQDVLSNITGSTANSELTIGADGGGAIKSVMEVSLAAAVANKQLWSAIGIELGTPIAIASSTDATPVVVTTTPDHGLHNGDSVRCADHVDNVVVNNDHLVIVTGAKTFEIHGFDGTDRVGSGAGAGSGGTIDIVWHGGFIKHRNTTTSYGDMSSSGVDIAVATDKLSLWILNRTDASNVDISAAALRGERICQ